MQINWKQKLFWSDASPAQGAQVDRFLAYLLPRYIAVANWLLIKPS